MSDCPPATYRPRLCCHACKRVFHRGRDPGARCQWCWPAGTPVDMDYFRWESHTMWWKPWTWGRGRWIQFANQTAYVDSHD